MAGQSAISNIGEDDFAGVAFPWRTYYIYEFDRVRLEEATTKKQGSVRSSKSQR